jgi:hypothetical protein
MGVTTKKNGVSVNFCRKLAIFNKTELEYGGHDQEIRSFDQFLPQTGDFR